MTQQKEFTCCCFFFIYHPAEDLAPAPRFEPCGRSSAELAYGCLVIMSLSLFCGNDRDHSTMKKSRKFYTTVHDWADFPLLGWAYILLYYCTGYVLYCKRDELFTMGPVLHTVLLLQLQRELMNKTNDQFGFRCHSIIAYLDVKSICLFKWAETHRRIQCKWSIVEKWQK